MPSLFSRGRTRSAAVAARAAAATEQQPSLATATATMPVISRQVAGNGVDEFGRSIAAKTSSAASTAMSTTMAVETNGKAEAKGSKKEKGSREGGAGGGRRRLFSGPKPPSAPVPRAGVVTFAAPATNPSTSSTPSRRDAPASSLHNGTFPASSTSPRTDALPPRYHFLPTRFPLLAKQQGSSLIETTSQEAGNWAGVSKQDDDDPNRAYGYISIDTGLVLGLEDVVRIVDDVAKEMEDRALTTPMLFSSAALDLSAAKIRFLIRSYVATLCEEGDACKIDTKGGTTTYRSNLRFAHPQELAWFLRWSLARVVRVKGEPMVLGDAFELEQRGLIDWEDYEDWRGKERAAGWQADAWNEFVTALPPVLALCLRSLFDLLARLTAHSLQSGLTPAKSSSLFGPLLFGLGRTSCSFEKAHASYIRSSAATEHLLLAFIRSQHATHDRLRGEFPRSLKAWIRGYPQMIASDHQLAKAVPRKEARLLRVKVAHRTVRAYSRDLMRDGPMWNIDLPASPRLSEAHRRRLAIDTDVLPRSASTTARDSAWSAFEEAGFARHSIADRLQFDLTEGAKRQIADKRKTMTWDDFSGGGFDRNTMELQETLTFAPPVQDQIESWPDEREEIRRKLKKSAKVMAKFEHDTTPVVTEGCIEAGFLDAWVDVLVGWTDRDELTFREANFCILEYADGSIYVFEEVVPLDYQRSLIERPKKGFSIFRKKKLPALPRTHSRDEAEFDALMRKTETRVLRTQPLASNVNTAASPKRLETVTKPEEPDIETRTTDGSSPSTMSKAEADKWINVSIPSTEARPVLKPQLRPLPTPAAEPPHFAVSESQVASALHVGSPTPLHHVRKGSAGVQRILTDHQLHGPTQDSEGRSIHSMSAMQVLNTPTEAVALTPVVDRQQQRQQQRRVQEHIQRYRDAAQDSPVLPDPPRDSVASVVDAYGETLPALPASVARQVLVEEDVGSNYDTAVDGQSAGADDTRISNARESVVLSEFSFEAPPKLEDIEMIARQPSPGRYEHGAPLHFVGEEPEEEDEDDYVHKTPARQIRRR